MADKEKNPEKKKRFGAKLLGRIAIVLFILFCAVSVISMQNTIIEKRNELAELDKKSEAIKLENDELKELIESDDLGRYMEKIAVENNDYAYPDERRYYDTSRD